MTKIALELNSCQECPNFYRTRYLTEDSWEEAYNWFCKKSKNEKGVNGRKIEGYVEWNDVNKIKVPDWCPISDKKEPESVSIVQMVEGMNSVMNAKPKQSGALQEFGQIMIDLSKVTHVGPLRDRDSSSASREYEVFFENGNPIRFYEDINKDSTHGGKREVFIEAWKEYKNSL